MVSPHLTQKTHKLRNGAKDSSPVSDACTFHHTACGLSYMAGGQGPGGPCESSSTPRGGGGEGLAQVAQHPRVAGVDVSPGLQVL